MRQVKYRGWHTKTKKMLNLNKITPLALLNPQLDGVFIPFHEDVLLMRYTGLNDKNGKEIFEGDIITDTDDDCLYEVYYECGCFLVNCLDGDSECVILFELNPNECCELIGNIHENPEIWNNKDGQ